MNNNKAHIVPPCHADVKIIYHDDYLLVIDKPEPLLSTPGRLPENKDSAISRLHKSFPSAELVHRLDMATSGLMVVSLSKAINRALSIQFQQREVEKHYEAILYGTVTDNEGSIDFPLIADWPNRPKQKICYETGKPSLTHYHVLERSNNTTRVLYTPITGRSHQLRLHSLAIGHPILGCHLYSQYGSENMASRLLLHAKELRFTHPMTEQKRTYTSPTPF